MSSYTILNVDAMEDMAPKFGLDSGQAHFPTEDVGAQRTGFSHQKLLPERRQAFGHRHDEAEEVYFVVSGAGRVKLDDEIAQLRSGDALRVAPGVTRCFEAGPEGLEFLAFGARHEGDGEMVPGWWEDDDDA